MIAREENSQSKYSFYSLCAIAFLAPLVFSPQVFHFFALPQVIVVQAGDVIAFTLWLINTLTTKKIVRIKRGPVDLLVFAFLLIITISTFVSIHRPTSLLGSYGRYEGFFTFLAYATIFFLATQINWREQKFKTLSIFLLISASLIALEAVLEMLGYLLLPGKSSWSSLRSASTLGNPSLLGSYLAMIFPISIGSYLLAKNRKEVMATTLICLLLFAVLLTTFTRGAWVATGLTTTALTVLFLKRALFKKKLLVLGVLLSLILTSGIIFSATKSPQKNLILRFETAFKIQGSLASRLEIWKTALPIVAQNPILGSGPDTFPFVFQRYQLVEKSLETEGIPDNAHNWLFQLAVTVGIPATLMITAAIIILFWRAFSQTQKLSPAENSGEHLFLLFFLAGAGAYFISILFTVNQPELGAIFWLFLGIINGSLGAGLPERSAPLKSFWLASSWKITSQRRREILAGIGIVLVSILILLTFIPYLADMHYREGNIFAAKGETEKAIAEYKSATYLNPYVNDYWETLGKLFIARRAAFGQERDLKEEMQIFEQATMKNPLRWVNYIRLANAYIVAFKYYQNPAYLTKAKDALRSADNLRPSAISHYLLGYIYNSEREKDKAIKHLKKALTLDPSLRKAKELLNKLNP